METRHWIWKRGNKYLLANLHPPCPRPEHAMGLPSHSDHGLLTLLIQNGNGGIQFQQRRKWANAGIIPLSISP